MTGVKPLGSIDIDDLFFSSKKKSIPEPLAVPWQAISDVLDIPPVLTYASNDLWNWKLIDNNGPYTLE